MKAKNQLIAIIVAFAVSVFFLIAIGSAMAIFDNSESAQLPADRGMEFSRMDVKIEWRDDRSCRVTQNIQAEFLDDGYNGGGSHGIYVDIPVNSGEKVRGLTVKAHGHYTFDGDMDMPYSVEHESGFKLVRVVVGDSERTFYEGDTMSCTVEYDYITPVHPENKNLLDINAIGYGWMSPVGNATVTVTYPTAIGTDALDVSFGSRDALEAVKAENVTISSDGKTVVAQIGALEPFNGVRIKGEMPDGFLRSSFDIAEFIPAGIGMLLLLGIIVLMFTLGKDKPLTPVVNFYPPRIDGKNGEKRKMLPVQMGKIIDGVCSLEDVTSLIFYWASEGYLAIEEDDDETYFVKLKELDEVTSYEKRMFDKLFDGKRVCKDGTSRVALGSLKGHFSNSLVSAKTAVDNEFRGRLYKTKYNVLAAAMVALTAVYGVSVGVLCTFKAGFGFFNFAGAVIVLPVLLAAFIGNKLAKNYIKLGVTVRRLFTVLLFASAAILSAGVMLLVPTHVMTWAEKIVFAVSVGFSAALAPFLTVRTEEYTEQLNEIVGFRDFIRDVEKDKLEALLADDPQYYYNILPYANVLGVSDIWSDKFEDLTVEPPAYYRGRGVSVFDVMMINHLCRSVGSSLAYTPPKASGGSFSGGSSGGSHGGGSFGGFGGGGGGRW